MKYHSCPSRAGAEPNVETFYRDADIDRFGNWFASGWYYRWIDLTEAPTGPFETEAAAVADFTNDLPWSQFYK